VTTASAAMKAHLDLELLTLASGIYLARTDGVTHRFTTNDKDGVFSALSGDQAFLNGTYSPLFSFTRHSIEKSGAYEQEASDISFLLDDTSITELDVRAGLYDGAQLTEFWYNWDDISMGIIPARNGRIGDVKVKKGHFTAQSVGMKDFLRRRFLSIFQKTCRVDLFSPLCTLSSAAFLETATVATVTDRRVFTIGVSDLTELGDFYDEGKVRFTSGLNSGVSMEIDTYNSGTDEIALYMDMPFNIAVSDTLEVLPGCKKRWQEDCHVKYANAVNFQGESLLPGNDEIIKFPD